MNDRWVELAIRIQSIAQAGLSYGKDPYDRERYQELRQIAAEMMALKTDLPVNKIYDLFCNESGYQTPKIDTRAAVFRENKILLVRENNGTWALPGGWCDVDQSVASNAEKEVREEAGLIVHAEKIIAVQDWRKHNVVNYPYGIIKIFVLCQYESGTFEGNIETTVNASTLPCFTTDYLTNRDFIYKDRINIPIRDADADITFFLYSKMNKK